MMSGWSLDSSWHVPILDPELHNLWKVYLITWWNGVLLLEVSPTHKMVDDRLAGEK